MSDSEEPPTKLSKIDNGDDDTDASFDDEPVTGCISMPEITNLPETTDLPAIGLPETTKAPQSGIADMPAIDIPEEKLTDLPQIVNMPDIANLPDIGLPDLSSITEVSAASKNVTNISETAEISLPREKGVTVPETDTAMESDNTADMLEERLQESLGSQDSQHEEWLSEGVLTDDDFNTSAEASTTNLTTTSNKNNVLEQSEIKRENLVTKEIESKPVEQNIEDALNSLEGGMEGYEDFLVKKKDVKHEPVNVKTENDKEDNDGNDTDDLLRMLGGDDNKTKKKLTKTVKDLRSIKTEMSSSEDEFEAKEAPVKKLKQAKALIKKDPPKAAREESDGTSDESVIMKKMLGNKRSTTHAQDARARLLQTKASINILSKNNKEKIATSTPLRQPVTRSLLKPGVNTPRAAAAQPKNKQTSVQVKREPNPNTYSRVNKPPVKKPLLTASLRSRERGEIKEELKEFEEEDQPNEESDTDDEPLTQRRQNSMKPEEMNEDMLSDAESHSEDGSLYDELPSSDSDDIDDWFQLDIRAEKAGDYLPLLGLNAKEVLLEEKSRVAERLRNLKKSLSALTESGKKQAEQVRSATLALAELDDMLKAA